MLRLDHGAPALAAYHTSKHMAWNPRQIEMGRDVRDWAALAEPERDVVTRLLYLFGAAQSTALVHLPALSVALARRAAPPGDLVAAAAQLAEVARHVDAYDRWLVELAGDIEPPLFAADPHYRALIEEDLPAWLDMLLADDGDAALMRALCTCHLVVAGVLIEAGHAALAAALRRHELLPGLCLMLDYVRRDVARHADVGAGWLGALVGMVGEGGPGSGDAAGSGDGAGEGNHPLPADDAGSRDDPGSGSDPGPATGAAPGDVPGSSGEEIAADRVTVDALRTFLGPRLRFVAGSFAAAFAPWGQSIPLGIDLGQLAEDARRQLGARMEGIGPS